ncbi:MAG: metal-dependent transcriptional regulator [Lewinellaceae bacterium]|nr:metal-dependent transcriptional regulator [Phaeodactylibacter sp.]MCB9038436.1 metal-dependent transcriptional regulator [Lewinellaceae bacterium]
MEISYTEENYLKAIFKISERDGKPASTNAISGEMSTSAASVTDMVKRLSDKALIHYERYRGVTLTEQGEEIATHLIRKHRLWEVFLVDKLHFSWDEVHEIAEQLEHIKSRRLVERLDEYLGFPKFDPHGDPIPDADGNFTVRKQVLLSELKTGEQGVVVGVQDHTTAFLQYLGRMELVLGTPVQLLEFFEYDESMRVLINEKREQVLSKKVCQNLFIQKR